MSETKKRVRRSVDERIEALEVKMQKHRDAIRQLEEKKAALLAPKKRRTNEEIAKEIIKKAKKSGLTAKDIAEKLGVEID